MRIQKASRKPLAMEIRVDVVDVEAAYGRAITKGGVVVGGEAPQAVLALPHGSNTWDHPRMIMTATFRDPFGHVVRLQGPVPQGPQQWEHAEMLQRIREAFPD